MALSRNSTQIFFPFHFIVLIYSWIHYLLILKLRLMFKMDKGQYPTTDEAPELLMLGNMGRTEFNFNLVVPSNVENL